MIFAYHFVGDTLRDGRPVPPDGVWLEHDGGLSMCQSGLHASQHPADALKYAPGFTLCRVAVAEAQGTVGDDKMVGRARWIYSRIDAKPLLLAYARRCAADVLHLWNAPEVVRTYLLTGDESIREAARESAYAAAYAATAAATTAASYAAYAATTAAYAASDDANAAAYAANAAAYAAYAAAYAASNAAAYAASEDAAKAKYRQWFAEMVDEAFEVKP